MSFHIISMCSMCVHLRNREHDELPSLQLIQLSCYSSSSANFIQTNELACNTYNYLQYDNAHTHTHSVLGVRIPINKHDACNQLTNRNPTNPSPSPQQNDCQSPTEPTDSLLFLYTSPFVSIRMGPTDTYCSAMREVKCHAV